MALATRDAALEHVIWFLLRAGETGMRKDRKAATDQVRLILQLRSG